MKSISASWIFPVSSPPVRNGIVTIEDDGTVVSVSDPSIAHHPSPIIHHNGIIVPGFVNTHCHLELSHMRGAVREHTGMAGFIGDIVKARKGFEEEEILAAIGAAESEMIDNGIVAVGDISNTDHSFVQKAKGNIYYHTFIEVFDLDPANSNAEIIKAKKLQSSIVNHRSSIVPHAPYSVTPDLFLLIAQLKQEITTIHNQESKAENELFSKKSGSLYDRFSEMGNLLEWLEPSGKNSIRSVLPFLLQHKKIQLVHNTFTSKKDLAWAQAFVSDPVPGGIQPEIYWCTCPNANLYIEKKLPDYPMFISTNAKMTIGTDSYASNHSLSILDEMKTIQKHFPQIGTETLLKWATFNGAEFLGIEKSFGSIEKGKKPGLVLIEGVDPEKLILAKNCRVKKIA